MPVGRVEITEKHELECVCVPREELEASSSFQRNGLSREKLASAFQTYSRLLNPELRHKHTAS